MTDLEALRIVPPEPMDGLRDRVAPRRTRDATIAAKLGCSFGGPFGPKPEALAVSRLIGLEFAALPPILID
ncbi:MAG: hypothetical protein ACOY9C_14345 [Pseudomonadota bacterium]